MCGIAGLITTRDHAPDRFVLERMIRVLKHRGPDRENIWTGRYAGFAHQRLSIIDLQGGSQPMTDASNRYTITFNGEIYNYREIRSHLEKSGCRFKTDSDTEVLLQAYIAEGDRCLESLVGMFAFTVWYSLEKKLFAARDRVGKKPFFYASWDESLLFASEIKSLLQYPGFPREVNLDGINDYLGLGYETYPQSAFKHVTELPPAHFLIWKAGKISTACYWRPSFVKKTNLGFDDAKERFHELFKDATKLRMISDVPLGAFLSGGIDSTLVIRTMSQASNQPIKTFSIGFKEIGFNELPYAKQVAEKYHTDHHEFMLEPSATEILPNLVWHYDQPFSDVSALPSFYIAMEARNHVTVVLNGDGGDENFAGYPRFKSLRAFNKIPSFLHQAFAGLGGNVDGEHPKALGSRIQRLLKDFSLTHGAYFRQMVQFRADDRSALFSEEVLRAIDLNHPENFLTDLFQKGQFVNKLDGYLLVELLSYLPGDLLTKMDRATMAYGLEARSPFLDHRIIEFAASLPFDWKLKGNESKIFLKETLRKDFPTDFLNRPKQGFGIPIDKWLRGDLKKKAEEILFSAEARKRPYFKKDVVKILWDHHQQGKVNYGHRLWSLLVFECWHRQFIDQAASSPGF